MLRRISSLFSWQSLPAHTLDTGLPARPESSTSAFFQAVYRILARPYVFTVLAFSLVIFLSIQNHFIQDDGFITLR